MYATIFHYLSLLSAWLETTQASLWVQDHDWVIPTVQSIHILGIAAVAASALMINMRLFGLYAPAQPFKDVLARFVPFIWWTLIVLLLTGFVMMIAEPPRSLKNPIFQIKMTLLVCAMIATGTCQLLLRFNPSFGDLKVGGRGGPAALATMSLAIWVCIIFAGRWIAYYY